jgi:hypothetical protein
MVAMQERSERAAQSLAQADKVCVIAFSAVEAPLFVPKVSNVAASHAYVQG